MTVKELKEKLDKLPDDTDILVAIHCAASYGCSMTSAYDSPHDTTFMYGDNKLLICGYDDDGRKQSIKTKDLKIEEKFVRI